jgi:hypothetical protein
LEGLWRRSGDQGFPERDRSRHDEQRTDAGPTGLIASGAHNRRMQQTHTTEEPRTPAPHRRGERPGERTEQGWVET